MPNRATGPVLVHLSRLLTGADSARTDRQLLDEFLAAGDEMAFAAILRRHGPMVLAVCRRLLTDPDDMEDAFQATFLVLVRRARSLGRPERLGNWLYGVAYRTALKARGQAARRRRQTRPLTDVPTEAPVADLVWRELRPILDDELQRLPENYRTPVVLCCLEGLSKREAARRLGWPEGTLSARLHRARHRLRQRLAHRGLTLSAGVVAAVLSPGAAPAAVSAALILSTARTASLLLTGRSAAAVPAKVAALTESVVRAMVLSKLKVFASVLFMAGLLAGGLGGPLLRLPTAFPQAQAPAPLDPGPTGAPPDERPQPKKLALDPGVTRVVWSPDGQLVASYAGRTVPRKGAAEGDFDHFTTVKMWDARTGKEVVSLGEVKNSGLVDLAFSPDGKTLALSYRRTIPEGDKVELWDARTGQLRKTLDMDYGRIVPKLSFAPDGKTLAVLYAGDQGRDPQAAGLQGGVRLWDLETGKVIRSLRGHKHLALSGAFSPDGAHVATGGDQNDNAVRLWDQRTGRLRWVSATAGGVLGIAFSPDGKIVATGQSDGRLVLWDVAMGKEVRSFVEVGARNGQPSFSPDGRLLLGVGSVEKDGRRVPDVKLWDVQTGKLLRTWTDVLGSAAFVPGRHTVAILGTGGVLWLWDLRQAEGPAAERPAAVDDGFRPLVDQLLQGKRSDAQVVEALFLATLGRFPAEGEAKLPLQHLASKQQSRREAIEDILHALKHSKGYFARLDALQRTDPRKRP